MLLASLITANLSGPRSVTSTRRGPIPARRTIAVNEFYIPPFPDFRNSPLFYVYVHCTTHEREIYYVGKGQGRRYKQYHNRNVRWLRKARKHGVYPEVLWTFKNEACALSMEIALIKFIGRKNLVNLTDGGEGASGTKLSDEARKNLSIAKKELWKDPEYRRTQAERVSGASNPMYGKTGVAHPSFGKPSKIKGRKRPEHSALMSGSKHPNHDPSIYSFIHKDGRREICTKLDMRFKYGLNSSSLSKLCAGRSNHVGGWKVENGR